MLEEAMEPYRRAGFVVTSQSESAITLALVSYILPRERSVCLRYTSQGYIEVSGYTLEDIATERRRGKFTCRLVLAVMTVVILLILLWVYLSRMR